MSSQALSDPTVLLTGFEPFGGAPVNPSWLGAQALHGRQIAGHRVVAACLPTAFNASLIELRALLAAHQPALVLCVGVASERDSLSLERVAVNLDGAQLPDNRGAQPVDKPIVADGPAAYFSTLPIKPILRAMKRRGLPVEVSYTAGTFVCNHVFYGLMHALTTQPELKSTRGGFVHVPELKALGIAHQVSGLYLVLETSLDAFKAGRCLDEDF